MPKRSRRGRNEGSIFQRKTDGLWVGRASHGYGSNGKRNQTTVYGKTKGEAQRLRQAQNEGPAVNIEKKLTVADYLKSWLESTVKPSVAPTTYARYEQISRLHVEPYLGGVRLDKLAPLHVQQLFSQLAKKDISLPNQQKAGVLLHTAMRDAVRLKLVPFNPCADIAKPRLQKKKMQVLDSAQVQALLKAAAGDRLECLYVVAIASGARQGELFALDWSDVDFAAGSVQVQRTLEELKGILRLKETKSANGRRRIQLPKFALDALHEHRKRMLAEGNANGPVFCDVDGGHLRRPNVQRRSFHPLLAKAGVPMVRFHDLRHTAATLLLMRGVHPKIVSERLGHASIEITLNTYSHVLPTMQQEAADKLDKMLG